MSKAFKTQKNKYIIRESDKTKPALDLTRTVVKDLFQCKTRPWEAINELKNYIRDHGHELPYDEYDEIAEDVWVHVTAYLSPTAKIESPAIICGGARVCHYSTVECSVIGSFATVGELSSLKNSIMFDKSKLWGHNHLCSSILGYESFLGAGTTSVDTRLDNLNVAFEMPEGIYLSGKSHLGAVICDGVKVGASCVINPGAVIDVGAKIYPLSSVSGYVYPYTTVK